MIKDDAAGDQLRALGVDPSNIIAMENVPALIAYMKEGGIDMWCYGDMAGRFFMEKVTGDPGISRLSIPLKVMISIMRQ